MHGANNVNLLFYRHYSYPEETVPIGLVYAFNIWHKWMIKIF
jgi:hypothetical protein